MTVHIESLRPGDEQAAREAAHLFDDPVDDAALGRFLGGPRHHLLVAYDDEAPAGFITGIELEHPDKPRPEMFVYEVGVDPDHRGKGIAQTLLEALLGLARERGCGSVFVLADQENAAGVRLYESAGGTAISGQVMFTWDLTPK